MCSAALAADEKMTAGIKIGTAGQTAAVNVTYSGTESLTLLKVQLNSAMEIESVTSNYNCTYNSETGMVLISCYETGGDATSPTLAGITGETVLFTVNYNVPDPCATGSYPINVTVLEARNADTEIMLTVSTENGSIEVGTLILGDVDGDGLLTTADLVSISRYIVGNNSFTAKQIACADMDGDNLITTTDLVILSRLIVD